MTEGPREHDDAVAAAREHLAAKPDPARPLGQLPDGFALTRASLHFVAEHLLKPKRELETGNEIALGFAPGGFGTPPWERGEASGTSGEARAEGVELVSVEGGVESRAPIADPSAAIELLGIDAATAQIGEIPSVHPDAALALADWFALGTVVLAELIERHPDLDPAPIRLWPEHFDVATELGSEPAGQRANYGASPGDDDHLEPYLYVGPWDQSTEGELWNATAFVGAELLYADLLAADDQIDAALEFMAERVPALR